MGDLFDGYAATALQPKSLPALTRCSSPGMAHGYREIHAALLK
jgi:hypothetical protein